MYVSKYYPGMIAYAVISKIRFLTEDVGEGLMALSMFIPWYTMMKLVSQATCFESSRSSAKSQMQAKKSFFCFVFCFALFCSGRKKEKFGHDIIVILLGKCNDCQPFLIDYTIIFSKEESQGFSVIILSFVQSKTAKKDRNWPRLDTFDIHQRYPLIKRRVCL